MLRAVRKSAVLTVFLIIAGTARSQNLPPKFAPSPNQANKGQPAQNDMGKQPINTSSTTKTWPKEIENKGLHQWGKDLDSKDPSVREMAIRVIIAFGPDAKVYLPKIMDHMSHDQEYNVRFSAVMVLSQNPIEDEKMRAEIVRRMLYDDGLAKSSQVPMRTQIALAFMLYKTEARAAIELLTSDLYLKFPHSFELRMASAAALGAVGGPDPPAPPATKPTKPGATPPTTKIPQLGPDIRAIIALVTQLNDPCLRVREEVARAFMRLGKPIRTEDLLQEKRILVDRIKYEQDAVMRNWLRAALIRLDPTEWTAQIREIAAGLLSDSQDMRVACAQSLGQFGPQAKDLVPNLVQAIKPLIDKTKRPDFYHDETKKLDDRDFLYMSVWALGSIGPGPDSKKLALPVIQQLKNHPDELVRKTA